MNHQHPEALEYELHEGELLERADCCGKCGHQREWRECWQCVGEGVDHHDCGEDCCVCLDPQDNVTCDICRGAGGWKACPMCAPADES